VNTLPSVEEYFEQIGYGHPSVVPFNKFESILALYEDRHCSVETYIDEDDCEVVKVCPVTGEELRRYSAVVYNITDKNIEDFKNSDDIQEALEMNKQSIIVTENATDLLACLPRAQSECLNYLIHSLVQNNQGCATSTDRRFMDAVKILEKMLIVKPVKNGLKKKDHYSYRLAPYIAYKGSKGAQENAICQWMVQQAQDCVKALNARGNDFPTYPIKS
jgi:hypothetical protein